MKKVSSKNVVFLIIIFLLTASLQGQDFIPPSPNASSLGLYGDIPTNNYTGVPRISIPLYDISSGSIDLSIGLNYHSSGIKVSQEASWVGLGWSLEVGGVITRQIRGKDDFDYNGYISAESLPERNNLTSSPLYTGLYWTSDNDLTTYEKIEQFQSGMVDAQPDMFYYNFCGYSGRLLFEKQSGNIIEAVAFDQNNLKFSYNKTTQEWEIKDEKGWTYIFGTKEISRTYTERSEGILGLEAVGSYSQDEITAWYIDEVETPTGDLIEFSYSNTVSYIESPTHFSQSSYSFSNSFDINGGPGFYSESSKGNYNSIYYETRVDVIEVNLNRIDFENGYIQFNKVNRLDRLKSQYSLNSSALSNIEIFDTGDKSIKKIDFDYSYFNSDKSNDPEKENFLRLKLDGIQESFLTDNQTYISKPQYTFEYNSTSLPEKNSSAVDHWGYYNGRNNDNIGGFHFINLDPVPSHIVHEQTQNSYPSLTPRYTFMDYNAGQAVKIFINGADRNPNETTMRASVLERIHYPTGGSTEFTYEPHDYYDSNLYEEEIATHTATSLGTSERNFTLSKSSFVFLSFELINDMYSYDPSDNGVMENMTVVLEEDDGSSDGPDILKFIPEDDANGNPNTYQMSSFVCVALDPGNYTIKADDGGYVYLNLSLSAKYIVQTSTSKKMVGGLRIQKINVYKNPNDQVPAQIEYSYLNGSNSSGKLMTEVQNFYNETDILFTGGSPLYRSNSGFIGSIMDAYNNSYSRTDYIVANSTNLIPLGNSAQGNHVGYSSVRIIKTDFNNNDNGYTDYNYHNEQEEQNEIFFPGIPNEVDHQNGNLLKEEIYNSDGILLKERVLDYDVEQTTIESISGIITLKSETPPPPGIVDYLIAARYYDVDSEWGRLTSETIREYGIDGGGDPIIQTKSYYYENFDHKLISKISLESSNGVSYSTTMRYPDDVDYGLYSQMSAANMHNYPIETLTYQGQDVTDGKLITYRLENNMFLPDKKYSMETSTPISETSFIDYTGQQIEPHYPTQAEVSFEEYNTLGRVIEFQDRSQINQSIIWDLSNQYRIATTQNASIEEVFHSSFEDDEGLSSSTARTGSKVRNMSGSYTINKVFTPGSYLVSYYWRSSSSSPWELQLESKTYSGTSLTTTKSTGQIDELRVHPADAVMTTYTYDPLVGMTSQTDPNGLTTYYEYDDFGRLKLIRDKDGNILQETEYNYAQ